jgi:cell division ATPase FtsA
MEPQTENGRVGELVHRITDDVKLIARDELELVRDELKESARNAAIDAAVALLGGIVGLIGMGMLCATAVVALAPVIPALWLRLLIMSIVYLVSGGAVATAFGLKLKNDAVPNLGVAKYEGKRTLAGLKETLVKKENASHA